jgi:hypothetical protein
MTDYSIKRFSKYTDTELIAKLQDFARESGKSFVSGRAFEQATGIAESTATNHFGSWRKFCTRAGLAPRYQISVSRSDLFENLDRVWQTLGRQPRWKEMKLGNDRLVLAFVQFAVEGHHAVEKGVLERPLVIRNGQPSSGGALHCRTRKRIWNAKPCPVTWQKF